MRIVCACDRLKHHPHDAVIALLHPQICYGVVPPLDVNDHINCATVTETFEHTLHAKAFMSVGIRCQLGRCFGVEDSARRTHCKSQVHCIGMSLSAFGSSFYS